MFTKLLAMKEAYLKNEDGATAIEYGLIAGAVAVVIIVALGTVGDNLTALFTTVGDELGDSNSNASGSGGSGSTG